MPQRLPRERTLRKTFWLLRIVLLVIPVLLAWGSYKLLPRFLDQASKSIEKVDDVSNTVVEVQESVIEQTEKIDTMISKVEAQSEQLEQKLEAASLEQRQIICSSIPHILRPPECRRTQPASTRAPSAPRTSAAPVPTAKRQPVTPPPATPIKIAPSTALDEEELVFEKTKETLVFENDQEEFIFGEDEKEELIFSE